MEITSKVDACKFFLLDVVSFQKLDFSNKTSLRIDFRELTRYSFELSRDLLDKPKETFKAFNLAIEAISLFFDLDLDYKAFQLRFYNIPQNALFADMKRAANLGKFIQIHCILDFKEEIQGMCTLYVFDCPSCRYSMKIFQDSEKMKTPEMCPKCKHIGKFREYCERRTDIQRIFVKGYGSNLGSIEVLLKDDLTDPKLDEILKVGTKISVTGVLSVNSEDKPDFFIEANDISLIPNSTDTTL